MHPKYLFLIILIFQYDKKLTRNISLIFLFFYLGTDYAKLTCVAKPQQLFYWR